MGGCHETDHAHAHGLGDRLFQFALVADTHVNESEDKSSSPFATNAMANGRARFVLESMAQLDPQPAFVVHLGDIVHPVPSLPTFEPAVSVFKEMARALRCPLYVVPGNHDVGDKRVDWMPAGGVTEHHVMQYRRLFGPDYFAFDHGGCRFIALNAQLLNSGLAAEQDQQAWLEDQLAASTGRRVFLFSHYPPHVSNAAEPGSYDNIDEPARTWLLRLIEEGPAEAFFAGHVHNFWYDRIAACQMYLLPATSFMRHDYAELFRVGPADEFGRNDVSKFGYFLVNVHERGHVAHFIASNGQSLEVGQRLLPSPCRVPPVHTRTNWLATLGVDLRHPWAEMVEIAATGGVQEFERKLARNDYPTLAMWGMGVRRLRVPLQDFADECVRARMRVLRECGHEFLVYSYGLPAPALCAAMASERGLVSALEVVLRQIDIEPALPGLAQLRKACAMAIFVSKLRTHEDAKFDGSTFSHFINHGFVLSEVQQLGELAQRVRRAQAADGLSIRVARRSRPLDAFREATAFQAASGLEVLAHVRLAGDGPAQAMTDDVANASRVAEAVWASALHPEVHGYVDTFMDVDRGYFPRTGFIDRRCEPRLACRVYANLHSVLALLAEGRVERSARFEATGEPLSIKVGSGKLTLALPNDPDHEVPSARGDDGIIPRSAQWLDLATGVCRELPAAESWAGRIRVMCEDLLASNGPGLLACNINLLGLVRAAR